ncbi:MBL fold metallo-hydrolase [Flavivirga jejuensis]|uniref:MBL fold metallo-hydrolase n=1 Tax=Flavivirga jejuensis TaxID=870487 RepID=A0ABT8WU46_9FLAO|nr:MBL fold metallo-hydrolase [Flavivirga jejuensis]MDO5976696.1 MBL fold metallo-hydrolase [Flavivirga jejuensis]
MNENNIILKAVLITHSHSDHTDLAERFAESRDVSIFMSSTEIDTYKIILMNLKRVEHQKKIVLGDFVVTPLITPGHTMGSTCYLIENNLFSGDTAFIEGVGICHPNDTEKLYLSIQFLKLKLAETTMFWPGHSFGKSPGKELSYLLRNNVYFQLEKKNILLNSEIGK